MARLPCFVDNNRGGGVYGRRGCACNVDLGWTRVVAIVKRLIIPLIILLAGCANFKAGVNAVKNAQSTIYTENPATPDTVKIPIRSRENLETPFTIIGEVRDKLGTVYDSEAEIIGKLKAAARQMGGHALTDFETRTVDESYDWIPNQVTYYKARVVRYEDN